MGSKFRMIPMLLMMGIIFYLSSKTGDSFHLPTFPGFDKIVHSAIYAVLAITVIFAQNRERRKQAPLRVITITVVACLLYGISDELHQSVVPGRFPSVWDIVADIFGAAAACAGWLWLRRRGDKKGQEASSSSAGSPS